MKSDKGQDLQLQFSMRLLLTDGSSEKKLYNFDISQITTVDSWHIGVATASVKQALIRAVNALTLMEKGGYSDGK